MMKVASKSHPRVGVWFDPAWKSLVELASIEVFELMAGVRPEVSSVVEQAHGNQTAMVGMAGALCGMTTLRCSKETALKFASLMLGKEAASSSAAQDALGELCNMIAGNFKAKVSTLAEHCLLSVPTVISGEDYELEVASPTDVISVALHFQGAPVWVTLTVHS